jgi:hypothetical protein
MKRMLKAVGGVALVMALVCLVATSVQARTSYSFNFGFGGYYPYGGPAYYSSGYCYPYAYAPRVYYYPRRAYRYYYAPPVYYYGGGPYYCR